MAAWVPVSRNNSVSCLSFCSLAKYALEHVVNAVGMVDTSVLDIIHSSLVMGCLSDVVNFGSGFLWARWFLALLCLLYVVAPPR